MQDAGQGEIEKGWLLSRQVKGWESGSRRLLRRNTDGCCGSSGSGCTGAGGWLEGGCEPGGAERAGEALGKDYVIDALAAFPSDCRTALDVAHRMDARLVNSVTARLLVTEKCKPLRAQAQTMTQSILAGAVSKPL